MAYFWCIYCAGASALKVIHTSMWFAVNTYVFFDPQNANQFINAFCMNIRSIVLFWDPFFQLGLLVSVVKMSPLIFSLLSKCVVYVFTVACCPLYAV